MAPQAMTPEELADQLERLHQESFGWALACCGWDRPAAEDVLQTSYLRVLAGQARFGGRSAFRTWLFGVIRRVSQEYGRSRRSRDARAVALDAVPAHWLGLEEPALEHLDRAETSRRLLEALQRLPERQREVLHLVFYQEMTIAEAARAMGVSLGSARTHYERGKRRMRGLLMETTVGD
jgi:RNA polymerase sigma-70 factor (ECF subfamily)